LGVGNDNEHVLHVQDEFRCGMLVGYNCFSNMMKKWRAIFQKWLFSGRHSAKKESKIFAANS